MASRETIFTLIEAMTSFVREGRWDELEAKYEQVATKHAGEAMAASLRGVDMVGFQDAIAKGLKMALVRARKVKAKAVYFEYDLDNGWHGEFFVCPAYAPESEGDEDWSCDFDDDVIPGPDQPEFARIYKESPGFVGTKAGMGTTACMIARTVASFGRAAEGVDDKGVVICMGFHDQDPILRVREPGSSTPPRKAGKAAKVRTRAPTKRAAPRRAPPDPRRELIDLLLDLSVKVFEPPLCELRENGALRDLSSPLSVLTLVIDFETEVAMNGLVDFLGNSTGRYAKETVAALKRIGCADDAAVLRQVLSVASRARMTHEAIQEDRQKLAPFAVSTFAEVHGPKWERALSRIEPLSGQLDFDRIRRRAEEFVAKHLGAVKEALGRPSVNR